MVLTVTRRTDSVDLDGAWLRCTASVKIRIYTTKEGVIHQTHRYNCVQEIEETLSSADTMVNELVWRRWLMLVWHGRSKPCGAPLLTNSVEIRYILISRICGGMVDT